MKKVLKSKKNAPQICDKKGKKQSKSLAPELDKKSRNGTTSHKENNLTTSIDWLILLP